MVNVVDPEINHIGWKEHFQVIIFCDNLLPGKTEESTSRQLGEFESFRWVRLLHFPPKVKKAIALSISSLQHLFFDPALKWLEIAFVARTPIHPLLFEESASLPFSEKKAAPNSSERSFLFSFCPRSSLPAFIVME